MKRAVLSALGAILFQLSPAHAQEITLRPIAAGLDRPVAVTHANDARLFIATQRGEIFVYDETGLRSEPFLDIRAGVLCCGEQGLLGVAFHPRHNENGWFYVSYVNLAGDTVLARYRVSADGRAADPSSQRILLTIAHRESDQHFSGHLAFGPDGDLYMSTGDGGGEDYLKASRLDSLLGKILRIDVDREPYAIPPSNPFAAMPAARGEIWAYGLRNPWRFSFDRKTGDLWIGDVGQDLREEINLQPATSSGGENYGWYGMEGTYCHADSGACQVLPEVTTPPVLEYEHKDGGCSVTGGYRYRGTRFPKLRGVYFYGDFCTGTIAAATRSEDGAWVAQTVYSGPHRISSFGEDAAGELYVVDYRGSIYALESTQNDRLRRDPVRRGEPRAIP